MTAPSQSNPNAVAIAQQGAVTVLDGGVEYNLDQFPTDRFNRLVPTQTIRMPSDLVVPVVNVVQLESADSTGKSRDHYRSNDVPTGHRALTARGLNKVADAAGVSFYGEHRIDDGTDPNVIGVAVTAEVVLPTGQRRRTEGAQTIDLRTWFGSQTSDAEKAKFRKQFYAHVATRARNRALRALLSMAASYTDAEVRKPFAVVTFAPNLNHPEMRQAFIGAMTGSVASAYGPAATPQLQAPEPQLLLAPPIEDVDDTEDGRYVEVRTNGHATVERVTGEVVASRPAPDFGVDDAGDLDFGAGASIEPPTLQVRLAALVDASSETAALNTDAPTIGKLQALLRPLGNDAVQQGVQRAFGVKGLAGLEVRHGKVILAVADTLGDEPLRQQWRDMIASADR